MLNDYVNAIFEANGPYLGTYGPTEIIRLRTWAEGLTDNDWRNLAFDMGDYRPPTPWEQQRIINRWIEAVIDMTGGQR